MELNFKKEVVMSTNFILGQKVADLLGIDGSGCVFTENRMPGSNMKLSKKLAKLILKYEKLGNCELTQAPEDDEYSFYDGDMPETYNSCILVKSLKECLHSLETHVFSKKVTIYITTDIDKMKQVSDNKGWSSCYNKDGCGRFSLQYCLWNRDAVAYCVSSERSEDNWNARVLLRRDPIDNKYFLEGKIYSDKSINEDLFIKNVKEILAENNLLSENIKVNDEYFFGYSDLIRGWSESKEILDSAKITIVIVKGKNITDITKYLKSKKIRFWLYPTEEITQDRDIKKYEELNKSDSWIIMIYNEDVSKVRKYLGIVKPERIVVRGTKEARRVNIEKRDLEDKECWLKSQKEMGRLLVSWLKEIKIKSKILYFNLSSDTEVDFVIEYDYDDLYFSAFNRISDALDTILFFKDKKAFIAKSI